MHRDRKAFVVFCDEFHFNLTGKAILSGVYLHDILIFGQQTIIPQMVFFFQFEAEVKRPFKSILLRVKFPEQENAYEMNVPIDFVSFNSEPRRTKIVYKQPFLIQSPILRPGRLEASVVDEDGIMDAGGIWIVSSDDKKSPLSSSGV